MVENESPSRLTLLFDLDGTLTDSGEGIVNSVAYALEKFGIRVEDKTELYKFVGPPLVESLAEFYSFTPEAANEAVGYYREYFQEKGIFENRVYEGMEEILKKLKAAGKRLVLATSKPEEYAVRILEHFHLAQYFDLIAGASMDGSRIRKADVIAYALKKCGLKDPSQAVMIGDRKYDVLGAAANGLETIGVLYGYGSREELLEAGAVQIIERVEDLAELAK